MTGNRRAIAALLLAAALISSGCAQVPPGATAGKTSPYPRPNPTVGLSELGAMLGSDLQLRSGGDFGGDRMSVHASSGTAFGEYVEVFYPAGSASQKVSKEDDTADSGGAQGYFALRSGPLDDAYLRYSVWFPARFDFVKGGKLPGLYGGRKTSGGKIPDGVDGFSTRYMWRQDGAGEVYAYLPSSVDHGTSLGRGTWSFPTGRWTCLVQHVHLNTPGASDGSIQVSVEGKQVLDQQAIIFRTAGELRIEGLFFSTFFGGGDETWETPRDQLARFGGFAVSASPLTC